MPGKKLEFSALFSLVCRPRGEERDSSKRILEQEDDESEGGREASQLRLATTSERKSWFEGGRGRGRELLK